MSAFYQTKPLATTMVLVGKQNKLAKISGEDVEVHFHTTAYMTDGEMVKPISQDVFLGTEQESIATRRHQPLVRVDLDSWISEDQAVAALNKVIDQIRAEGLPRSRLVVSRKAAKKMLQAQKAANALYHGLPHLPPSVRTAIRAYMDDGVSPECRIQDRPKD